MREEGADAESLKRQLMMRAGAAASLVVVLLGGLAVYERLNRPAPEPARLPGLAVPPAEPSSPAAAPPPAETSGAAALPPRDAAPEPELTRAPELAPPGRRQPEPPEPAGAGRGAPRLVLGGDAAPPPAPARTEAEPPVPVSPPSRAAPAETRMPGGGGYLVQLGVFGSQENAEALRARLASIGMPARLESRVVVGPFPDKAAARAAQARLREAGHSEGVIVPPRR
jgi:DedD protein